MIKVLIPALNHKEIDYTFYCLLKVFLGVEYNLIISKKQKDIEIVGPKAKVLIKNTFFSKADLPDLLLEENLPSNVDKGQVEIENVNYPLVSIYGKSLLQCENNTMKLDSDLIGSTFFMLSRWEEYANSNRDNHDRFIGAFSVAKKFEFLDRAVVNEYIDILWALLVKVGYTQPKKTHNFTILPTHDVDIPYKWPTFKSRVRNTLSDLKNLRYKDLFLNLKAHMIGSDPFDKYDFFMNLSEKVGVKSHFFFMSGGKTIYDNRYKISDPRIKKLTRHIQSRGHKIGIHPSYDSFNTKEIFKEELNILEKSTKQKITFGRQHYLRHSTPTTMKIWDENNMEWDSTLGFADMSGFRSGVCYSYPLYDFSQRVQLSLYEKPLIVMEATLAGYEKRSVKEAILRVIELKNTVKKYNGEFVFLWHNSSFNSTTYKGYSKVLEEMYSV